MPGVQIRSPQGLCKGPDARTNASYWRNQNKICAEKPLKLISHMSKNKAGKETGNLHKKSFVGMCVFSLQTMENQKEVSGGHMYHD